MKSLYYDNSLPDDESSSLKILYDNVLKKIDKTR